MAMVSLLLSILSVSGALAQCSRNPDLFITAPQKMEALRGSCLQIPCTFRPESEGFDSNRASFGVWIKNDSRFDQNRDNVIFNGTGTVNKYAANITGNLSQKNCTTLFSSLTTANTDSYFFRIENERFKATASCHPVQINVRDSAPSPRIHISGDQKENESVGITCSAVSPCPQSPPTLSWTLRHESQNKLEQNTDGTFTVKIQETITLSDKDDGRSISCSAMYPVNEGTGVSPAEGKVTLSVSYVPKDTSASISPSGGVSAGTRVNLTCSSRANPPISRFTWFKQTTGGSINVSERDIYSFNATDEGVYFCVATNALGNQTSPTIRLNFNGSANKSSLGLGGIIGIVLLICLLLCVCAVVCWRRLKSTQPTAEQHQSQTAEELPAEDSARKTEEEYIHYGQIEFSKLRPEPSPVSLQDSGQQQDTVYAQVKVSQTGKRPTQTADGPEDIYTQVKKK